MGIGSPVLGSFCFCTELSVGMEGGSPLPLVVVPSVEGLNIGKLNFVKCGEVEGKIWNASSKVGKE